MGWRVQGSGFRVQGSRFRVQGSEFGVEGRATRDEYQVRSTGSTEYGVALGMEVAVLVHLCLLIRFSSFVPAP
jgi:hypothetical protein